ncbi:hypothetical protein RFI_31351 [Reticulomyxa filosa]|uniref:S-adenosyl-L-homocysteine hydrolase NAD binding domain-containing protein n=1 Tax=Reticulomyxa filosa TaxID=46433 RepID=X6LXF4_RETFI|nr:hypothetical protein RFI_31351 [Reticulomyxa filosa]|eukprot:ETO06046.1 hypothetical protein RFI_31351 [Reticulomyxa filosa]
MNVVKGVENKIHEKPGFFKVRSMKKPLLAAKKLTVRKRERIRICKLLLVVAEVEMPGLMACREEMGPKQLLKGANISGYLHMTIQTAVLIETLQALDAEVRCASCNIFSTQDHAAAAVAAKGTAAVFAWKGETLREYWDCTLEMLTWFNDDDPNLLVDDGGDATLLIHEGVKWEKKYEANGELPDPSKATNAEFKIVLTLIKEQLKKDSKKWHKIAARVAGVSEETTTSVHRLYSMATEGALLFPAINVNDSVTKPKFDNIYGCRHSLPDGIMSANDVMIAGKQVMICGYGDVGVPVVLLDDVVNTSDIFITATGNKNIIMLKHMVQMKNNEIVGNIGHFDNEIDIWWAWENRAQNEKILNLNAIDGCLKIVMVIAQIDLWENNSTRKYKVGVYILTKVLYEKVTSLNLYKLVTKLTPLSKEQSEYLGIKQDGPFKSDHYRYYISSISTYRLSDCLKQTLLANHQLFKKTAYST